MYNGFVIISSEINKTFRSKVHLRLRSGSLSAIALFQKVHLRLRIFCLFALTELTLFMHRIGTFEKRAMRLRAGGLSAIALLQKVHLRLRIFCLFACTELTLLMHRTLDTVVYPLCCIRSLGAEAPAWQSVKTILYGHTRGGCRGKILNNVTCHVMNERIK